MRPVKRMAGEVTGSWPRLRSACGSVGLTLCLAALYAACPDPQEAPDVSVDISAELPLDGGDATVDVADAEVQQETTEETLDDTDTEVEAEVTPDGDDGDDGDGGDGDVADDGGDGETDGEVAGDTCDTAADCVAQLAAEGLAEACVLTTCNTATKLCEFDYDANNGTACGGDDPCIQAAACDAGACVVSQPTCDDGDPCTQDLCDDAGQCSVVQLGDGDACDDGLDCTIDDVCDDTGACAGAPTETCQCQQDSDCDGLPINACTGAWICDDSYACVPDPEGAVICDSSSDTECMKNTCDPETATCAMVNVTDGVTCDSGDICIPDAVCSSGLCEGPSQDCDDGNPCTTDVCDSGAGGCVYTDNDGGACDDNDICTVGDICSGGSCVGAGPLDCDDGNDCTTDQCEPGQGGCVNGALTDTACDDGDPCTVVDTCNTGSCVAGATKNCDDGNPCTDDSCDPTTGACINTPNAGACSDGNACTTGDTCVAGACVGTVADCDDENPCTVDGCQDQDGAAVCLNQPTSNDPCDDGDPCTASDFCFDGVCVSGLPEPSCAGCTQDSDCDDFDADNLCVGEYVCSPSTSQCEPNPATVVTCSVNETDCTENGCDPADGQCKMLPKQEGTTCDDGDDCTEGDGCNNDGFCTGAPKACSDGNDCTSDECGAGGVCQHNPLSGSTTYHDEDFNAGLPAGWSTTTDNGAINWAATSAEDVEGGGMAMRVTGPDLTYNHGRAEARLDLPPTLLQGNSVKVLFSIKADFAEDTGEFSKCFSNKDYAAVRIYTSPTSWTSAYCLSKSTGGEWVDVAANLPTYSTQVTVSFVFHSNDNDNNAAGVVIDNVRVISSFECGTGVACIPGICSGGTCNALPANCDDNDACTTDTCNTTTGACEFEPVDNCECTVAADCGFSFNPCIEMACISGQCAEVEVSGSCDDDNLCTLNDTCQDGVCTGDLKACDDGEDCTMDECDPFQGPDGCTHTPATLPCDDGDLCTFNDTCDLTGGCSGEAIDCNEPGCLQGTCNSGTGSCEFNDIKQEGSINWSQSFENDVPGTLPAGWDTSLGNFVWEIGFGNNGAATGGQTPPFYLAPSGPTPAVSADVVTVTLPMLTVPADGGYLSYYLALDRTDAYGTALTFTDDVLAVLINGQLFQLVNADVAEWTEQVVELDASLGGQDIEIQFEWRNGANSEGAVAIDTLTLRAHAPCDDGDACTEDDQCNAGICGGTAIPGCP